MQDPTILENVKKYSNETGWRERQGYYGKIPALLKIARLEMTNFI